MPTVDTWGARLTRMRDVALVGFGGVYAFGYLARALHAWENNLGVLPGVELQYFVAGLVLLLPPSSLLAALFGLWRLLHAVVSWERNGPERRQGLETAIGVLVVGGMLVFAVTSAQWFRRLVPVPGYVSHISLAMFVVGFGLNVGLAMVRPAPPVAIPESAGRQARSRVARVLERIGLVLGGLLVVNVSLSVLLLFLVAMLVGSVKVLPVLPQALGGAAPRCAQFDVDMTKVSPELAAVLVGADAARDPSTAARPRRSRQVLVYYSGADSVLFKLPRGAAASGPTYELKRSAYGTVLWCRNLGASPAPDG